MPGHSSHHVRRGRLSPIATSLIPPTRDLVTGGYKCYSDAGLAGGSGGGDVCRVGC
jgi:hypothetical protein